MEGYMRQTWGKYWDDKSEVQWGIVKGKHQEETAGQKQ